MILTFIHLDNAAGIMVGPPPQCGGGPLVSPNRDLGQDESELRGRNLETEPSLTAHGQALGASWGLRHLCLTRERSRGSLAVRSTGFQAALRSQSSPTSSNGDTKKPSRPGEGFLADALSSYKLTTLGWRRNEGQSSYW